MCVVWSYWNTRDWAHYNWNVPNIHGIHVIKWNEMSLVFARIKQSVMNATDVLLTLVHLVFVWCIVPPHCPFTISCPLIVTMNQHSVWVEVVLSTPLGRRTLVFVFDGAFYHMTTFRINWTCAKHAAGKEDLLSLTLLWISKSWN
jgi:hypothetical protein